MPVSVLSVNRTVPIDGEKQLCFLVHMRAFPRRDLFPIVVLARLLAIFVATEDLREDGRKGGRRSIPGDVLFL